MVAKLLVLLAVVSSALAAQKLQEIFSWNMIDWNYPDLYSRQQAIQSGDLMQENALPVGIERWKNKLFISVPRWKAGVPATLNYIPLDGPYDPSPKLNAWPSMASNELGNCKNGLNTVYRIKADKCDRLWVLDVGTYGIDSNTTNLCPYSLNVYDLNTDQRIRRYVFRPEDIVPSSFIANIAIDEGRTCDDTFAYFSDERGYGLIAYSWELNRSWRFNHGFFMPDPLAGDFNVGGMNFQWSSEGIFGITPSPAGPDGYRTLFFSPLASNTEFAVSTRILRNESAITGSYRDFEVVGDRGDNGHTTSKVMDEYTGVELFNLVDQNAIGCWRSDLPLNSQNIAVVDKDDTGMIFPSDIKIDSQRNVWVLSDKMPVFLESALNTSNVNFRVFTAPFDVLVQDTVCQANQQIIQAGPTLAPYLIQQANIQQQLLVQQQQIQQQLAQQQQFQQQQGPQQFIQQQQLQQHEIQQPQLQKQQLQRQQVQQQQIQQPQIQQQRVQQLLQQLQIDQPQFQRQHVQQQIQQPQLQQQRVQQLVQQQQIQKPQLQRQQVQPQKVQQQQVQQQRVQQQPYSLYDLTLAVTTDPITGAVSLFSPVTSPRPDLGSTIRPGFIRNAVPTVEDYVNIPKLVAVPYTFGQTQTSTSDKIQRWQENQNNYEVYENE